MTRGTATYATSERHAAQQRLKLAAIHNTATFVASAASATTAIGDGDHEGIVAKRMDAPYRAGPHNVWLKIKNRAYLRREAVEWRECE